MYAKYLCEMVKRIILQMQIYICIETSPLVYVNCDLHQFDTDNFPIEFNWTYCPNHYRISCRTYKDECINHTHSYS